MREVLSIHIGQTGIQIGDICWELYCIEHGIDSDGQLNSFIGPDCIIDNSFNSFFSETQAGKYVPRALFIDLCQEDIWDVQIGMNRKLYQSDQFIVNKEQISSVTYARGRYTIGKNLLDQTLDRIHKFVEQCPEFEGFMLFHSFGGGTGSGFFSLLLEHLQSEYSKKKLIEVSIFPDKKYSTSFIEPYNTVLSFNSSVENSNCCFLFDNKSLHNICFDKLNIEQPKYKKLDSVLCQAVSSITTSFRFENDSNVNFFNSLNDFIPYNRLHYPICSYAPFVSSECSHDPYSTEKLTELILRRDYMLFKCNPFNGMFMSCESLYRGDIDMKECNSFFNNLKDNQYFKYCDWNTNGFKCCINYQNPKVIIGGDIALSRSSACMIANTTAISKSWCKIGHEFDLMYEKRAFMHWYIGEGMEEAEFKEARENLELFKKDLNELDDDENDEDEL